MSDKMRYFVLSLIVILIILIMKKQKKYPDETNNQNLEGFLVGEASIDFYASDLISPYNDTLNLIASARKGIKFSIFEKIASVIPFTLEEWSRILNLSERTIQRYKKDANTFEPIQSEKIISLKMLYDYGVEVFGNKEYFDDWLNSKNIALGNQAPKEFLDTSFGIEYIKNQLTRIAHGVLA